MRADAFIAHVGYAESRTRAARLISEGKVLIDGKAIMKPSEDISAGDHVVEITENDLFVGRGGIKLDAAIKHFNVEVTGKRCIDIGASTGGFTDCLLKNGARLVYAVDSGSGQLHKSLLCDSRVVNIEGYNARSLSKEELGLFDMAVMDVSFISQTLIHAALSNVLNEGAIFISLIKPQFEAGRHALGKKGIVKDPADRKAAIMRVLESALANRLTPIGVIKSPIEGGDGNREYLACFIKGECPDNYSIDSKTIAALTRI